MQVPILPVFLFVGCTVVLVAILMFMSRAFRVGHADRVKEMPYESGMDPIHDTRRRFTVRFHLVAIAFLVFDVELLFLYPWAVAVRPAVARATVATAASRSPQRSYVGDSGGLARPAAPHGLDAAVARGWVSGRGTIFAGAMVFIALLIMGFLYDWRKGVFHWQ